MINLLSKALVKKKEHAIIPGPGTVHISTLPLMLSQKTKTESDWQTLPKGWTDQSLDKYAKSMGKENKEGPVSTCMDKIKGHVDDPGAFCAGLHDQVTGDTHWRGKGKEKKEGGVGSGKHRGARIYQDGKSYRALTPSGHNVGPYKYAEKLKSHLDQYAQEFKLDPKTTEADSASTMVPQLRPVSKKKTESKKSRSFKETSTQPSFQNHSFETILISEGLGNLKDCFFYTKDALKQAADSQLFEGIHCFADHPTEIEEQIQPERSTRDILGYYENVRYQEDADGRGSLVANLSMSNAVSMDWALSLLTNSIEYSKKFREADLIGLSINASGSSNSVDIDDFLASNQLPQSILDKLNEAKNSGITEINVVSALTEAKSVDLVTQAGAGGRILQMLEMERKKRMKPKTKKYRESEKKEAGMPPQGPSDPGAKSGMGTPDHDDEDQDKALFSKMIKQYLGNDNPDQEEMEAAKHAYEAHKEDGMEAHEAYEAAGQHLKMAMAIGKKMAQAHQCESENESESESESHQSESEDESESESESETHEESQSPPATPGKKGTPGPTGGSMEKKKESMKIVELSGEVAKLRESVKKYELRDHLDKMLKESGKSNTFTKKFREALGNPKTIGQINDMWKIFLKAADAGAEEVGADDDSFLTEKTSYRESGSTSRKFDLSDCLRK